MSFLLPTNLSADAAVELDRSCLIGGYDQTPVPTNIKRTVNRLTLARDLEESGHVLFPWETPGSGRLMNMTATLMQRTAPYHLLIELARGKLNQVRNQLAEWRMVGLQPAAQLDEMVKAGCQAFGKALTHLPTEEALNLAQTALAHAHEAADELSLTYIDQLFRARHLRQPQLDTVLGCRLERVPDAPYDGLLPLCCNGLCVPLTWRQIEPSESAYNWEPVDNLLEWAEQNNLGVVAGPLVDFSRQGLPDWLWMWEGDLASLATFMCDYVETTITRYKDRIRRWQITANSNNANVLSLSEDDLVRLTVRLIETALQVDPELQIVVGLSQPWGDYLTNEEHTYSPFIFADTLLRAGMQVTAFDLEWYMGVGPRGSYCRDLLEASRLLDLYALLNVPLHITLGYPSSDDEDPQADENCTLNQGHYRDGFSLQTQQQWAQYYVALALCKPHVQGVFWAHLCDAEPHLFPHMGLVDVDGKPKPALDRLRELRQEHLK